MAKDVWYSRTVAKSGIPVTGAAALNVRIARGGGMQAVVDRVASRAAAQAAQDMLDEINAPQLRLIKRKA